MVGMIRNNVSCLLPPNSSFLSGLRGPPAMPGKRRELTRYQFWLVGPCRHLRSLETDLGHSAKSPPLSYSQQPSSWIPLAKRFATHFAFEKAEEQCTFQQRSCSERT